MSTEADIVERLARIIDPEAMAEYEAGFGRGGPTYDQLAVYPRVKSARLKASGLLPVIRAEHDAAAQDMVLVPKAALLWLSGAGPDSDGKWFGQCEDEVIKTPRKYTPRYWWRTKFRSMVPDWPKDPPTLLATEEQANDPTDSPSDR